MTIKYSFFFVLLSFLFLACGPKAAQSIQGNISDAANLSVFIDKMTASGNARVLTNTKADANGKFNFTFEEKLDPSQAILLQ